MIVVGGEIDVKYGENGEKALLTGAGEFWVAEAGVPVAVAAWPAPSPEPHTLIPVHNLCPFKLGSPVGEMWYTQQFRIARAAGKAARTGSQPGGSDGRAAGTTGRRNC
jgi:hypothetical protein